MPTPTLSIGSYTPMVQNQVYALPPRACLISSVVATEVSLDAAVWSPFASGIASTPSGLSTAAPFIRSILINNSVSVREAP